MRLLKHNIIMNLLLALCIIIFLSFVTVIKSDQSNRSFLRFVGSYKYNTTDDGKITIKRYYMSHRIKYKWIESFLSCKSVGMRLAFIETDDERKNIAVLARRDTKLFREKVFVDGYNLTMPAYDYDDDRPEPEPCYSVQKESKSKLQIRNERCNGESNKFLCEYAEVVDSYEDPQLSDKTLDVKATFFTYIGNFETKKYYASFTLRAWPNNVPKICQSFGMEMGSPQNQAEYDNLGYLLRKFDAEWRQISIAGFRSEENDNEWVVYNSKLNYTAYWYGGGPHNNGDCLAMRNMGEPNLIDILCQGDYQFICEIDESRNEVKEVDQIDKSKLLRRLSNYIIGSVEKEVFASLYDVDWFTAVLTCKNYGMELLTPSSATEDDLMRSTLEKLDGIPNTLHVGITSMGAKDVWYSINNGKLFDYDFEWSQYTDYNHGSNSNSNCLRLRKRFDKFYYEAVSCTNTASHFVCLKIIETTDGVLGITSNTVSTDVPTDLLPTVANVLD